jgi:hypothetical protein
VAQYRRQDRVDSSYASLIIDVRKIFIRRGNKYYVEINQEIKVDKTVLY